MFLGGVHGSHDEKNQMNRLPIPGAKLNSLARKGENDMGLLDPWNLDMGNRDPMSDGACRSQLDLLFDLGSNRIEDCLAQIPRLGEDLETFV